MELETGSTVASAAFDVHTVALLHADSNGAGGSQPPTSAAPPLELLNAAGALRASQTLNTRSAVRLRVFDAALEDGKNERAVRLALECAPHAVVLDARARPGDRARSGLGIGFRAQAGDDVAALLDAGAKLRNSGTRCPKWLVALVGEDKDAATELLTAGAADVVVRGEPDETLPSVLEAAFRGQTEWAGSRGVSWRKGDGTVVHEQASVTPRRVAAPAWDLVDLKRYEQGTPDRRDHVRRLLQRLRLSKSPAKRSGQREAEILTTRACAPDCPTCHGSFGLSDRRDRTVREVTAEVRELVNERGVRHLKIVDHAFDGRPDRALEITRALLVIRDAPNMQNLRVSFPNGFRGDGLTPELIDALMRLGVRRFPLAIGTAAPRLQRLLKLNLNLERVAKNLAAIDRRGGIGHVSLYLGLPTETTGEAALTIRWASQCSAHTATFMRGSNLDFGPHWKRIQDGELDDFRALKRRALTTFYGSPSRAGRMLRSPFRRVSILRTSAPRTVGLST